MPDRIIVSQWIKTLMLENICLGLSSIDMNCEAIYQTWSMVKLELLNEVIKYEVGWANCIDGDKEWIEWK